MKSAAKIRNFVLIGSTGSGKSATCNMLFGGKTDGPFQIGHEEVSSCTIFTDRLVNKIKNIQVVDTPGFRDNRFHEKEIDKVIRDLTLMLTDPTINSSGVIDAFLLPVKFNPRPQTLKTDLEHFMDLFGTAALKTLIILPIYLDGKSRTDSDAMKSFSQMTEIMKMLKEGKGTDPNENWFCIWDNLKPYPQQEENLLKKIATVEPYTHKKFLEASEEIRKRLDARVQEEVQRHLDRAKKDFADDKEKLEAKIQEIETNAKKEREELLAAQQRAQSDTAKFVEAFEKMNEHNREQMSEFYKQMTLEREKANEKARELAREMNEQNQKQIDLLMRNHSDQMARMQSQMIELSKRKPPFIPVAINRGSGGGGGSKGGCFISSTQILLANKKSVCIQDLKPGDEVVTKDRGTAIQSEALDKWRFPEDTLIYGLNDEAPFFSGGHLFWTSEGWKAIEPEIAQEENPERKIAGKLSIGDIVFRIKQDDQDSLYDLIKIERIPQRKLGEDNYLYGLHLLDGHRSYHANGFLVAMNYPMFTFTRFKKGLEKLSVEDRKKLMGLLNEAGPMLDVVLGPFISRAFDYVEK